MDPSDQEARHHHREDHRLFSGRFFGGRVYLGPPSSELRAGTPPAVENFRWLRGVTGSGISKGGPVSLI